MAYSRAKLKSNGYKASPSFKAFLIRNLSDKCLSTRTLLQVTFRQNCICLDSFMEKPDSMRILYKIESCAFLKSMNSWCTSSFYSHFFSSIWLRQNIRSVVDMLRRNPCWWFPLVSSTYGVNLDCRMLKKCCVYLTKLACLVSATISLITLLINTYKDHSFHSAGNSSLVQIEFTNLWIWERIVLTLASISFAWIWSLHGALFFLAFRFSSNSCNHHTVILSDFMLRHKNQKFWKFLYSFALPHARV